MGVSITARVTKQYRVFKKKPSVLLPCNPRVLLRLHGNNAQGFLQKNLYCLEWARRFHITFLARARILQHFCHPRWERTSSGIAGIHCDVVEARSILRDATVYPVSAYHPAVSHKCEPPVRPRQFVNTAYRKPPRRRTGYVVSRGRMERRQEMTEFPYDRPSGPPADIHLIPSATLSLSLSAIACELLSSAAWKMRASAQRWPAHRIVVHH